MNKADLVSKMIEGSNVTKNDALKVVDYFVEVVTDELKKNDGKLTLVGFGTFKTITKKQKKGRNPRTGAEITIPKKRVVKFVPGKKLKDEIK
jgi:DNA-binding protein HU-beta